MQLRSHDGYRSGLIDLRPGPTQLQLSQLKLQSAIAVLKKGRSADPHPWRIKAGTSVGSSYVGGFAAAAGLDTAVGRQFSQRVRGVIGAQLRYARAERALTRQQLETTLMAGAHLVFPFAKQLEFVGGVQVGALWVSQKAERNDDQRIAQLGLPSSVPSENAWGPAAAAILALEYSPWTKVGFRAELAPSVAWLSVDDDQKPRPMIAGGLALVFRL